MTYISPPVNRGVWFRYALRRRVSPRKRRRNLFRLGLRGLLDGVVNRTGTPKPCQTDPDNSSQNGSDYADEEKHARDDSLRQRGMRIAEANGARGCVGDQIFEMTLHT